MSRVAWTWWAGQVVVGEVLLAVFLLLYVYQEVLESTVKWKSDYTRGQDGKGRAPTLGACGRRSSMIRC